MTTPTYNCPTCGTQLELYANGDNGPADDRWSCDTCGIEYPHTQFPLPAGYVAEARKAEQVEALARRQADDRWKLAMWNRWAGANDKAVS